MTLWAQIIHLRRATDRAEQVQRLVQNAPCPAKVIDAVDGQAQPADVALYSPSPLHAPRYPFALGPGEIACFLSHRKAWSAIATHGAPGIIYEDDTALEPEIHREAVARALPHLEHLGIVMFQARTISGPADTVAPGVTIPHVAPLRSTCAMYAPWAAARLCAVSERFDRPIDVAVQMSWVTGIRPAIVQPSGVTEVSAQLGGSTIQSKRRSPLAVLHREIARPLYRFKAQQASAQHRKGAA